MPTFIDRSQFPGLHSGIYANTPACGLISQQVADWRREQDQSFLEAGALVFGYQQKILSQTRNTLRAFLGVQNERALALVPNFSWGFNALLNGISSDLKVLTLEGEYPSLLWPLQQRGFEITAVPKNEQTEERMTDLLKDGSYGILAISLVQWLDGFQINLNWLKQIKLLHPDLIILADGTQYCGIEPFDFDHSGIDVLGSSGYKWMLGGYGNGFFCFNDRMLEQIQLDQQGFGSVRGVADRRPEIGLAESLEPGHQDSLSLGSLGQAVEQISQWGIELVAEQNAKLRQAVETHIGSKGLLDDFCFARPCHGMIYSFPFSEERWKRLNDEARVHCAQREGRIRIGFHFYNVVEEVEQIASLL